MLHLIALLALFVFESIKADDYVIKRGFLKQSASVHIQKVSGARFEGMTPEVGGNVWKAQIGGSDFEWQRFMSGTLASQLRDLLYFKSPRTKFRLAQVWRVGADNQARGTLPKASGDYFCIFGKFGGDEVKSVKSLYMLSTSPSKIPEYVSNIVDTSFSDIRGSQAVMWTSQIPCAYAGVGPVEIKLKEPLSGPIEVDQDSISLEAGLAKYRHNSLISFAIGTTQAPVLDHQQPRPVTFMQITNNSSDSPPIKQSYSSFYGLYSDLFGQRTPIVASVAMEGQKNMCFVAGAESTVSGTVLNEVKDQLPGFKYAYEIVKRQGIAAFQVDLETAFGNHRIIPNVALETPGVYRLLFWESEGPCTFHPYLPKASLGRSLSTGDIPSALK